MTPTVCGDGWIRKGVRVEWRGKPGVVVDDYWRHRDRFSVLLDGASVPLDFGADSLRLPNPPASTLPDAAPDAGSL
jgi:hypothetical protein